MTFGGSKGTADILFLLQSRIFLPSCPFKHEHGAGQDPRTQGLKLNSMKTRADGLGQPSAILKDFPLNAT